MIKVGAVSGDLLIKLALGAAVVGVAVYGLRKVSTWAAPGLGAVGEVLSTGLNPASDQNYAYQGTNAVLDTVVSNDGPGRNADGSITLGGWLFDIFNPDTAAAVRDVTSPVTIGHRDAYWKS